MGIFVRDMVGGGVGGVIDKVFVNYNRQRGRPNRLIGGELL